MYLSIWFSSKWSARDAKTPQKCLPMLGELHNTNTIDKFKECDKKEMMTEAGKKVHVYHLYHNRVCSMKVYLQVPSDIL